MTEYASDDAGIQRISRLRCALSAEDVEHEVDGVNRSYYWPSL